jgi:hypothetical protein
MAFDESARAVAQQKLLVGQNQFHALLSWIVRHCRRDACIRVQKLIG